MNNKELVIKDYYELLALHKTLIEAKFHGDADNNSILGSPFISSIANKKRLVANYTLAKLYDNLWDIDVTSNLTMKCTLLYNNKSIYQYSIEDLRLMISQNIGLDYLVPIALDIIESNLLSEGALYPGDLLNSF